MSKSQRKRRLRRRQVAAQTRSTAPRKATVAFTGSLLTTAALAAPTAAPALAEPAAVPTSAARAAAPGAEEVIALVRDANPGARGSSVGETIVLGDTLLMSLHDGVHGTELWRSDGSEAGTRMVADLNTRVLGKQERPGSSAPRSFTRVGSEVYFTADDGVNGRELWKTDGTRAGTDRVTAIPGNSSDGYDYGYYGGELTVVGGELFFTADDGVHGTELWKTDDTAAGASMVVDLYPGSRRQRPLSSAPAEITALGDEVVFVASDPVHGRELWRSDGTTEGTTLLADIKTGDDEEYDQPASSRSRYLTTVGDRIYFSADDGTHGHELWSTDGTTEGTALVRDLRTVASEEYEDYAAYVPSARPRALTAVGDTLYFSAVDDEHGRELWRADGGETSLVADITADEDGYGYGYVGYSGITVLDGVLYFAVDDGEHGTELWRSNGTAAGTRLIKDIAPGTTEGRRPRPSSSSPSQLTVAGDTLYFTARDRDGRRSLWTSDGTREGTDLFAEVGHDSPVGHGYGYRDSGRGERADRSAPPRESTGYGYSSGASDLTAVGDELFFTSDDGVYGQELWSTADAANDVPRLDSTARPRIEGETVAGGVLTATTGEWSPSAGLDHTYQWYVDGRAVRTATRPRFRPGSSDVGRRITVRVIATKPGWRGQLAYSATSARVVDEPLVNLAKPAARGRAEVGARLAATPGRWSVKGLRFSFRWRIDGRAVRGADSRFFRLPARAAGRSVTVRVTASRPAGAKSVVSRPRQVQR